jgi:hypothetical protein
VEGISCGRNRCHRDQTLENLRPPERDSNDETQTRDSVENDGHPRLQADRQTKTRRISLIGRYDGVDVPFRYLQQWLGVGAVGLVLARMLRMRTVVRRCRVDERLVEGEDLWVARETLLARLPEELEISARGV